MAAVETVLGAARAAGRPSLVGYVTGGIRAGWTDLLAAMIGAGADAVEIGLPFSDPMLDGPVIQRASEAALARGASPDRILAELRAAGPWPVPLIAMSYANLAFRPGLPGYCARLAAAGFSGTIIPDLPLAEADGYLTAAGQAGLDATLMVTPATPAAQRRVIAARTRGFLYVMSVMATTGTTAEQQDPGRWALAARNRAGSSARPVLIGFGIDTPARAAAAVRHADGVIVASALMRRVLDGATAAEVGRAVGELRAAVDGARQ
ncbi:MAG TPA: tryptophan synthase subunit alpha [Streptosporangiaceae bacterium]